MKLACEKYMQLTEDYILKIGTEGAQAHEGEFPWMVFDYFHTFLFHFVIMLNDINHPN